MATGTSACVFCEVVNGARPAHHVLAQGPVRAFLDRRPLFAGHTLVVPARHVAHLNELPDELVGPLWHLVRAVSRALVRGLGAEGTFTATNTVVSQSVPHLHVHVVPRHRGDGLRGFFWPRHPYPDDAEAAAVAARVADAVRAELSGS